MANDASCTVEGLFRAVCRAIQDNENKPSVRFDRLGRSGSSVDSQAMHGSTSCFQTASSMASQSAARLSTLDRVMELRTGWSWPPLSERAPAQTADFCIRVWQFPAQCDESPIKNVRQVIWAFLRL